MRESPLLDGRSARSTMRVEQARVGSITRSLIRRRSAETRSGTSWGPAGTAMQYKREECFLLYMKYMKRFELMSRYNNLPVQIMFQGCPYLTRVTNFTHAFPKSEDESCHIGYCASSRSIRQIMYKKDQNDREVCALCVRIAERSTHGAHGLPNSNITWIRVTQSHRIAEFRSWSSRITERNGAVNFIRAIRRVHVLPGPPYAVDLGVVEVEPTELVQKVFPDIDAVRLTMGLQEKQESQSLGHHRW